MRKQKIMKEKKYLPHHCMTQHLCLFALGLPAPVVNRKDRKTGCKTDTNKKGKTESVAALSALTLLAFPYI